jgi:hypothetical protein
VSIRIRTYIISKAIILYTFSRKLQYIQAVYGYCTVQTIENCINYDAGLKDKTMWTAAAMNKSQKTFFRFSTCVNLVENPDSDPDPDFDRHQNENLDLVLVFKTK